MGSLLHLPMQAGCNSALISLMAWAWEADLRILSDRCQLGVPMHCVEGVVAKLQHCSQGAVGDSD